MSLSRDQQRLIKMDVEIMNLRYLYEREVAEEAAAGKHTLLLSRGIRHRINEITRGRNLLAKSMGNALAKRETFAVELAQRKNAAREADEELQDMLQRLAQYAADMLAIDSEENRERYRALAKEIPVQRSRVGSKERAVRNWLERGQEKSLRMSKDKLPKLYNAVKDADALYGLLPQQDVITQTALKVATSKYEEPAPTFRLDSLPNYNEKPNFNTNADISMLTEPIDTSQEVVSLANFEFREKSAEEVEQDEAARKVASELYTQTLGE